MENETKSIFIASFTAVLITGMLFILDGTWVPPVFLGLVLLVLHVGFPTSPGPAGHGS